MKNTENNFGIILMTRGGFELFDTNQKKVFPYKFSEKQVEDLEIINKNELEAQVSLFINFYKIHPVPLVVILSSDICFELSLPEINETEFENKVNNFLYYLPFEETIHKIYKTSKGYYVAAINKDFIEVFKYIFIKLGFHFDTVAPSAIVGINVKTIDIPAADFIAAKIPQIKAQSMIVPEIKYREKKVEQKKVMGVNRVFILLSFFILLLCVLLFVLYQQSLSNKKTAKYNSYLTLISDHNIVK